MARLTAVGAPEPGPDIAALIAIVTAELVRTDPVADGEEYNRLFGDLVALERLRRSR